MRFFQLAISHEVGEYQLVKHVYRKNGKRLNDFIFRSCEKYKDQHEEHYGSIWVNGNLAHISFSIEGIMIVSDVVLEVIKKYCIGDVEHISLLVEGNKIGYILNVLSHVDLASMDVKTEFCEKNIFRLKNLYYNTPGHIDISTWPIVSEVLMEELVKIGSIGGKFYYYDLNMFK